MAKGYLLLPVFISAIVYGFKYVSENHQKELSIPFGDVNLERWNQDDKVQFLFKVAFYFSIFMLTNVVLAIQCRIFGGRPNPLSGQDPAVLQGIQRVLTNSVEQFFIFFPALVYLTTRKQTVNYQVVALGVAFIVGRAIFAVGYIFGAVIKVPALRAPGFQLNFVGNLIVYLLCFDVNPFQYL